MATTKCHYLLILCFISSLLFVQRVAASVDYKDALTKSLLYFEGQRSGKLPPNQRVTWRGDSGLKDGKEANVDLVGGYYDAGDNVKFGFPMAFTITMLAWSVVDFGEHLSAQNELAHALEAIRWGTDYLIKASPYDGILYGEVGEGSTDHVCWERPEDMRTPRTPYRIDDDNPGSDLAGETAAALAAASMAFKQSDPTYAATLLLHAQQLRDFAQNHRGKYHESITEAAVFYPSSTYTDELLWADAWLYSATSDPKYLSFLQDTEDRGRQVEFSWNQKDIGAQIIVAKLVLEGKLDDYIEPWSTYWANAEEFICNCAQKGRRNFPLTDSRGLLYFKGWNNLQYTTASLFLVMVYSEILTKTGANLACYSGEVSPGDLYNFVQPQVDYILGNNPMKMSYMVGFGENYPKRIHHRASSIVSIKDDQTPVLCKQGFEDWYGRAEPNPNVLTGAVVGGPNKQDRYTDARANVKQNEPTTVTVAPLVGILAKLAGAA
ncbi:hypothetical protein MKW92_033636 [Papaver armeniacum]|nr:hypothetical protein MKW92_033636 [Papaver armeniacum]